MRWTFSTSASIERRVVEESEMSGTGPTVQVLRQHLIDPEICIRCNTCEETCPSHAISHDSRNYVVDAAKCNFCNDCISPCPTGAIDSWRQVDKVKPYTLAQENPGGEPPPPPPQKEGGGGGGGGGGG